MKSLSSALALASALACADSVALPALGGDWDRLQGVRFGSMAADVLDLRREGAFGEDGVYREYLDFTTVASYGFLPWVEGRPPGLRDRLHGVAIRKELRDTVGLNAAWMESFGRMKGLSRVPPECEEVRSFRLRMSRAVFEDWLHMTLVSQVIEAGDGLAYEAFLDIRVETPELAVFSWGGGEASVQGSGWEAVPCPGAE